MSLIDSIRKLFRGESEAPSKAEDERLETMVAAQRAKDERIDAKIAAQERDRRL